MIPSYAALALCTKGRMYRFSLSHPGKSLTFACLRDTPKRPRYTVTFDLDPSRTSFVTLVYVQRRGKGRPDFTVAPRNWLKQSQ